MPAAAKSLRPCPEPKSTICGWARISAQPQTASFGPGRRFRFFAVLEIAHYACGDKIAQALP